MKRLAVLLVIMAVSVPRPVGAATSPIDIGSAAPYSVLGGQTVTNTGPSLLAGVGVWPGSAITGFPPGIALVTHAADTQAQQAQASLTAAYLDAAGRPSDGSVAGDLVGQVIGPGVYTASSSLFISGTVTLDGQGDPNAVFIFQIGSTLISASASRVLLINGAQACNVWWQVGSSATLGTYSTFVGNILALTSITVTTGVTVIGRALARNGAVTLDTDIFVTAPCAAVTPGTTVVTIPATTPTIPPVISTIGPPPSVTNGPVPTEAPTVPTVPGVSVPTTPSTVPGCTGCPAPTIEVTSTTCLECTEPTDDAFIDTTVVTTDCIPQRKSTPVVPVAVGSCTVTAAVCAGGARLLRMLRHR